MSRALSIVGVSEGREELDFYPTPASCTLALLDREKFEGDILEPACGTGAMVMPLRARGYLPRYSDIKDYGFPGARVADFLNDPVGVVNNVITNPPYKLGQAFVERALAITDRKVAMFLKLAFLESEERHEFFQRTPLARVYVFSKRQTLTRGGRSMKNKGMICFAWFVWEHGHKGEPVIKWIL